MSQRKSGYARKDNDLYETPLWVTQALIPHIPKRVLRIWEPASGSGMMVRALEGQYQVWSSDLPSVDFLKSNLGRQVPFDAVISNPPFKLADKFIVRALEVTEKRRGFVAFLLRTDFDHAISRINLFKYPFAKRLALRRRIKWFPDSKGSPSFNHSWMIWDWQHDSDPVIAYAP